MIGTKENIKIGDIIRAYDFPPKQGCPDCFIIGAVTDIDGQFFVAKTLTRVWNGKIDNQGNEKSQMQHSFRALCQGKMGFDIDYERVTILS